MMTYARQGGVEVLCQDNQLRRCHFRVYGLFRVSEICGSKIYKTRGATIVSNYGSEADEILAPIVNKPSN